MAKNKFLHILLFCLPLCGCFQTYLVKENLAEGQVTDPLIIRKNSGEKTWGVIPVYEDFFEGYIRGKLLDMGGQSIQGVVVSVMDEKGKEAKGFTPGITDNFGVYKVRFSLPVRWDRVDFSGSLSCGSGWSPASSETRFRLYFNRSNGVLSYSLKEHWLTVQGGESGTVAVEKSSPVLPQGKKTAQPASPPEPEKKKAEDAFGNFSFGQ